MTKIKVQSLVHTILTNLPINYFFSKQFKKLGLSIFSRKQWVLFTSIGKMGLFLMIKLLLLLFNPSNENIQRKTEKFFRRIKK